MHRQPLDPNVDCNMACRSYPLEMMKQHGNYKYTGLVASASPSEIPRVLGILVSVPEATFVAELWRRHELDTLSLLENPFQELTPINGP